MGRTPTHFLQWFGSSQPHTGNTQLFFGCEPGRVVERPWNRPLSVGSRATAHRAHGRAAAAPTQRRRPLPAAVHLVIPRVVCVFWETPSARGRVRSVAAKDRGWGRCWMQGSEGIPWLSCYTSVHVQASPAICQGRVPKPDDTKTELKVEMEHVWPSSPTPLPSSVGCWQVNWRGEEDPFSI